MHIDDGHFKAPDFDPYNIDPARLHGYSYGELDRSVTMMNGEFIPLGDPIHAVGEIASRQERITILDAGCGTGHQLYDLVEASCRMFQIDFERVLADGVSDHDFSDMAEYWRPRRAFISGALNYHVGDLNTIELPWGAYDLAYSYEVLVHNENPGRIVDNLWRSLRAGGSAYFNAEADQSDKLSDSLEAIQSEGGQVLSCEAKIPPLTKFHAERYGLPLPRRMLYRAIRPL